MATKPKTSHRKRDNLIKPHSCDTFVVLPPNGKDDCVIFGKNSDRPEDEVQEIVYIPAADHPLSTKVKCTYIEIDQVDHTHAVILSKPSWMWGAEMGANEHGVCIGNEAVWTKLSGDDDAVERLLGMDLLRLGLERSTNAKEALDAIVALLECYGQGGNCSDTIQDFTYHNSFIIADPNEAWVLECPGKVWAAERVTSGVRNISNELSIEYDIDLSSPNLKQFAEEHGFWDDAQGRFNFKMAFAEYTYEENYRFKNGKKLLSKLSEKGKFAENEMMSVLRNKPSGICMSAGDFLSTGSQVSTLRKSSSGKPSCHWFTGTPDPYQSIFKPFIFGDNLEYPMQIVSPSGSDRKHALYKSHEQYIRSNSKRNVEELRKRKMELEKKFILTIEKFVDDSESHGGMFGKVFKKCVEEEMNFYA